MGLILLTIVINHMSKKIKSPEKRITVVSQKSAGQKIRV